MKVDQVREYESGDTAVLQKHEEEHKERSFTILLRCWVMLQEIERKQDE